MKKQIAVRDKLQQNYKYILTEPAGKNFDFEFRPELTPKQMLALGVFGGLYLADCREEFPKDWFTKAKMVDSDVRIDGNRDKNLNFFGVHASQPLSVWQKKDWIHPQDPRGWFQWYCRYYLGRRSEDDARQIKRWKAMARHIAQIKKNCHPGDWDCHRKQRQALLHWAIDARKL